MAAAGPTRSHTTGRVHSLAFRARRSAPAGEHFTWRASALKKNVQQALYLDVRGSRADTFVRNAVASTGAALAAIWALATQIPTQLAGLPTQTRFLLFSGAVLAYVLMLGLMTAQALALMTAVTPPDCAYRRLPCIERDPWFEGKGKWPV